MPNDSTAAPTPPPEPWTGRTILLVEDDDILCHAIARMLASFDIRVLTAANGLAAIAVVDGSPHPIDLVLTDVVMPDLDGPGLMAQLADRGLHPPVIYMSGYPDLALRARIPALGKAPLLRKPFTLYALLRVVGEVLERRT